MFTVLWKCLLAIKQVFPTINFAKHRDRANVTLPSNSFSIMWRRSKSKQDINNFFDTKVSQTIADLRKRYSDFCNKEMEKIKKKWEKKEEKMIKARVSSLERQRKNELVKRWYEKGKQKKHTVSNSTKKKRLLTLIQKYSIYRDTNSDWFGNCIYCNCLLHITDVINGKKANWCHCITSSRNATAFVEENINLWCSWCNLADANWHLEAKNNYRINIDAKYGLGTYDKLSQQANQTCGLNELKKVYNMTLDELIHHRKKKMEEIKKIKK